MPDVCGLWERALLFYVILIKWKDDQFRFCIKSPGAVFPG